MYRVSSAFTKKTFGAVSALVSAAFVLSSATSAQAVAHGGDHDSLRSRHPNAICSQTRVPVSVPGARDGHIYGELCTPRHPGAHSRTVNLLVPGASYDHTYFDFPLKSDKYSYVTHALNAGYSTFAVDRLGTGRSSIPPSSLDAVQNQTEAMHQVITRLRAGEAGHRPLDTADRHPFSKVVWVGHSLGSEMAWYEAQKHDDVDAFVLTGLRHVTAQESGDSGSEPPQGFMRASDDARLKLKTTDPGYWTTAPGTRQLGFYYQPNAEQAVINKDESLKDLTNKWELGESATIGLPAAQAPSRAVTVPTLLAFGDQDVSYGCAATSPTPCTPSAIEELEKPFYPKADLSVLITPNSGHDIQLHKNAPQTDSEILDWIKSSTPSH
ncbi:MULTISPECIES: alpha/beta hydrolase [unclassified Streptomyces]|uniref:alpha/beta hydrolase n=1 Tax=unclassified Streptomyces TaxID=2593676 RepID=UPI00383062AA